MLRDLGYGKVNARMKKKLTHNLFLKILSVLFAAMLWIVVAIATDPYKTVIISDVPITIINEEEITGQGIGQIYSVVSPQNSTVSIKVYGQRSKVESLKASDIEAVVDFSEVSSVGAAYIKVTEPEGITILSKAPEMMKIEIEALEEKTFEVQTKLNGNVADGYMVNTHSTNPETITIIAPESVMQMLARAQVNVDVNQSTEDINTTSKITLYDASGRVVDYERNKNIDISVKTAEVYVQTLMTKEVLVEVETAGSVDDDHRLTGVSQSTEIVLLKGQTEVLEAVDKIVISKESNLVDLTNLTDSKEIIVDITDFLPEGTAFVNEDDKFITIGLTIEPLVERSFTIQVSALNILNLAEDLEIAAEETDEEFTIKLRGLEADLNTITVASLRPYINMTGYGQGLNRCRVYMTLPAGVTLVESVDVIVDLQLIPQEAVVPPVEPESPVTGA